MDQAISKLCHKNGSRRCATDAATRQLKAPPADLNQASEVATKRPGLYLTEFGYKNQPNLAYNPRRDRANLYWHTEKSRARWLGGWRGAEGRFHRGALGLAAQVAAKRFTLWDAVEIPPPSTGNKGDVDAGLFGLLNNGEITGERSYGKDDEKRPSTFRRPQQRAAYCAVRRWAISHDYFASPFPQEYNNACGQ